MASSMRLKGIVGNYCIIYLKFSIKDRDSSMLIVVWYLDIKILNIAGASW